MQPRRKCEGRQDSPSIHMTTSLLLLLLLLIMDPCEEYPGDELELSLALGKSDLLAINNNNSPSLQSADVVPEGLEFSHRDPTMLSSRTVTVLVGPWGVPVLTSVWIGGPASLVRAPWYWKRDRLRS